MLLDVPVRDGKVLVQMNRILLSMKFRVKIYVLYYLQCAQRGAGFHQGSHLMGSFLGGKAAKT